MKQSKKLKKKKELHKAELKILAIKVKKVARAVPRSHWLGMFEGYP